MSQNQDAERLADWFFTYLGTVPMSRASRDHYDGVRQWNLAVREQERERERQRKWQSADNLPQHIAALEAELAALKLRLRDTTSPQSTLQEACLQGLTAQMTTIDEHGNLVVMPISREDLYLDDGRQLGPLPSKPGGEG